MARFEREPWWGILRCYLHGEVGRDSDELRLGLAGLAGWMASDLNPD
jgi:hypothetical protein